ncbi:Ldh family oxidoreductase [Paramicrobacterium agarici]|uniref:LDH2 family malate/lactate/ureidoglycolate dehydrogenase n=1 Tax=Paramicrobacterium agarici TaxID=630514 RepID=A0A2A9DV83_9MICO|nr:Ldh family oxidoreductase [Microbacterium agarici]PFG29819.1 LDH2 family malate/lactate/ureidoglycolate dehydrogenase [Microbacterium agarici]
MTRQRFSSQQLSDFATSILTAQGVPEPDAEIVSASLVAADMGGHESHGMLRLPWYSARLSSGAMSARTDPVVVTDAGAMTILDGRDGIGQVLVDRAMSRAMENAERFGIGAVGVRNSNHFGTAGHWTRSMAERGYVGILLTNSSPSMAPWGGLAKTVGSNPWSIATPGGPHGSVVLDISNSMVARGKIYAAIQNDADIPDTWALDAEGRATTDPHAALQGTLQPIGEHKGYGISFMIDMLAGVLTGSGYADQVVGPYSATGRSRCGHLVIAIKTDACLPRDELLKRADDLVELTVWGPLAADSARIFVPGDHESENLERARLEGVQLPERTVSDLNELAVSLNVDNRLVAVAGS